MKIPPNVAKAIQILMNNGYEGYLVGGCVRDDLMGLIPNDYDIATDAEPSETLNCFRGFCLIETGLKHGTVTVRIDHENIEITSYRLDGEYKDNRHPSEVRFTKNLYNDLSRRDFTVNAMAYNSLNGLIDLFHGSEHINQKIITCVGSPDKRFNEDGLRIIRAMRFASVLGFTIESGTSESIHRYKRLLKNVSVERIYIEFVKLICGIDAGKILAEYEDVIRIFIPEFNVSEHKIKALNYSVPDKYIRLALILGGVYDVKLILNSLHSDNETINIVSELVNHSIPNADEVSIKHLLSELPENIVKLLFKMHAAYENEAILDKILTQGDCFTIKGLAVNGDDLIKLGFKPGRQIGKTLKYLLELVIEGKIANDKELILHYIANSVQ